MKHFKIILNIESLSCTGWGSRCVWSNKAPKHCLQKYKIPLEKLVITALIFCEYLYWLWLVQKLPPHTSLIKIGQSTSIYCVDLVPCQRFPLQSNNLDGQFPPHHQDTLWRCCEGFEVLRWDFYNLSTSRRLSIQLEDEMKWTQSAGDVPQEQQPWTIS